jgi:hypothetical protein
MRRPHIFELVEDAIESLDPRNPMQSARRLVRANFVDSNQNRLLHHHRGSFWKFAGNHYAPTDNETIRTAVWEFLERAKRIGKKGAARSNRQARGSRMSSTH